MRRTLLRRLAPAAFAVSLLGIATSAVAQTAPASATPPLALDRFYPAPPGDAMFGVQSPDIAEDLAPQFSVVADYAHDPLVLQTARTAAARGTVVGGQLLLHLQAGLALESRVFFHASFPLALYQQGGSPVADGNTFASPSGADVGDLRLGLRVRLLGEHGEPFQLALGGYLWVPTGKGSAGTYLGEGDVRGLPQILVGGRVRERVVWALDVGVDLRGSRVFGGEYGTSQGTMLRLDGGLGVLVGDARNLQLGLEGSAGFLLFNETSTPMERATNMEVLLGGKYRFLGDLQIGAGVGPGLTSGIGTPDVRAIGSVAYLPALKREAAPRDTDMDGVPDAADACPSVKGLTGSNPPTNGCPDSDGDGVFDAQDACRTVKGLTRPEPELDGCPESERDVDGVPDAVDAPATVNEPAPPERSDKDGDTIADAEDACPEEKGDADSDATRNGCPRSVRVTGTEILILQEVQFDSARASIKMVSFPLLDEVAAVLRQHPELLRLEVQGHTDDQGKADFNKRLSQDRAESVKKALVQRGVDAGRLTPAGYGQERPIADNRTPKSRQKNRRVQFVILQKTTRDKAPPTP